VTLSIMLGQIIYICPMLRGEVVKNMGDLALNIFTLHEVQLPRGQLCAPNLRSESREGGSRKLAGKSQATPPDPTHRLRSSYFKEKVKTYIMVEMGGIGWHDGGSVGGMCWHGVGVS